jgi:hypothetical protein
VGRLHYQKNFRLFLEVAAEVCERVPQAFFVIAGEGSDLAALEELSRQLGIASRVRFLGFVKEMPELYECLDLLLLTSHFEGTPLTVLEAMAMGVPVVASRVDGVAEVLEDGRDAMLVSPGRRDLFVEEICRVLADQGLRQGLARAGQEKARQQFSAEAMVRRVEDLYLRYLEDGGAPEQISSAEVQPSEGNQALGRAGFPHFCPEKSKVQGPGSKVYRLPQGSPICGLLNQKFHFTCSGILRSDATVAHQSPGDFRQYSPGPGPGGGRFAFRGDRISPFL